MKLNSRIIPHSLDNLTRNKTPILLIHGFLGSSRNFLRLGSELSKQGWNCHLIDQRGHGHSPWGHSPSDYTLDLFAKDLLEYLDQHQIEKAHLVGHSLGGRVCLQAASTFQNRVSSLCLMDVGVRVNSQAHEEVNSIIRPLPFQFSSQSEVQTFLDLTFSSSQAGLKNFLKSNLVYSNKTQTYQWIFDLKNLREAFSSFAQLNQINCLRQIKAPLAILRGDQSIYLTKDEVDDMRKVSPSLEFFEISQAGHWIHSDQPIQTKDALFSFIDRNITP